MPKEQENKLYFKEPIAWRDNIPVFSTPSDYINNYEKLAKEHLESMAKDVTNPWIIEDNWLAMEKSTRELIGKYAKAGDKILDVGVGLGRLLGEFTNIDKYGIDISFDYLEKAASRGINVCLARAEDMPYTAGYFDLIVCTDVLEHVFDLNLALEKILAVIKPGGVLIVRVPYREKLSLYLQEDYRYEFSHVRMFDEYSLSLLFRKIFRCEILEWSYGLYMLLDYKLKYQFPIYRVNKLFMQLLAVLKKVNKRSYEFMMKKYFDAVEINFVVKKPLDSQTGRIK